MSIRSTDQISPESRLIFFIYVLFIKMDFHHDYDAGMDCILLMYMACQ